MTKDLKFCKKLSASGMRRGRLAKQQYVLQYVQIAFRREWPSIGNCEEELPEKPVHQLSVDCRPTDGRQPIDGPQMADSTCIFFFFGRTK